MAMARLGWWIMNGLVGLLLLGTFVFQDVAGTWATYVVLVLNLILILWALIWPPRVGYDPGAWFFVIAWALIAIAFTITNQPGRTDYLLAANFVLFALYPLLSGALQRFARPGNSLVIGILSLVGAIVSFAVAGYEVWVLNWGRAVGYEANAIRFGTIALLLGFFALVGMFAAKGWRRYLFMLGPVFGIGGVLLSGSRGPLLALPALIVLCLVMLPIRRAVSIGVVLVLVVAAGGLYVVKPSAYGRVAALPGIITDVLSGTTIPRSFDESGNIRYTILQGAITAFQKSPLVGYGWYWKTTVVAKYMSWDVGFGDPTHAHLHSDILDFGVSAGAVGLLAYLLVLLAPIASLFSAPRDSQRLPRIFGVLVLSIVYLFCGAVNLMFGFELMTTMYVVVTAVFIGYCRDTPPQGRPA